MSAPRGRWGRLGALLSAEGSLLWQTLPVVARISLRNLRLHRLRTLLVGSILLLGTLLLLSGSCLFEAVDQAMERTLVNSVAGHIQLYRAGAKESFQLFGNMDGSMPDVGVIENFPALRRALLQLDNVATVVPMGIDIAVSSTENLLERQLAALRAAVRSGDLARQRALAQHLQRVIAVFDRSLSNAEALIDVARYKREYGDPDLALARVRRPDFWSRFEADPYDALEYLENEVGPLGLDQDLIWLRYLGTDTALFRQTFDRFEVVDGTMIPPGQRGFLFNKRVYEEQVKNKTARRLDLIKEKLDEGLTIARCPDCQSWIRLNVNQTGSLLMQLDPLAAEAVGAALRRELGGGKQQSTAQLLRELLAMDDQNFAARHALFYRVVAPRLELYSIKFGDELVLTAFARGSGYTRKVPVKVYGTFRFRSLDRSPLAGGFNLVDLMSFRELYGYLTPERRREQETLRRRAGVKAVTRAQAEALFAAPGEVVEEQGRGAAPAAPAGLDLGPSTGRYDAALQRRVYSQSELDHGVVVNAAVMLKDGSRAAQRRTLEQLRTLNRRLGLGVAAIGWREASGVVGQLVDVIRYALYGAMLVIFLVALIIVNNALLLATLERTREIGTLRAIGAQRSFVLRMIVAETVVMVAVFGGCGAALGSAALLWLGHHGIPATTDFFHFLFSGPRLYPALAWSQVALALASCALVALIATLSPARLALRVTPREAMAEGD
ncbi:MAG: FtsX-like permease family protein [Proteobacteria bacterium]|nr:FtsX-like permease family protein [Pseudomonadota bacterium]